MKGGVAEAPPVNQIHTRGTSDVNRSRYKRPMPEHIDNTTRGTGRRAVRGFVSCNKRIIDALIDVPKDPKARSFIPRYATQSIQSSGRHFAALSCSLGAPLPYAVIDKGCQLTERSESNRCNSSIPHAVA